MTDEVKNEILFIRDGGWTNMFDIVRVKEIAEELGYNELVEYLEENRAGYVHFILTGEEK